jgi:5-methyltetrahydrofolate--homocysteine methyltransferase
LTDDGIVYPETPEDFAKYVFPYYNHGARIIGGLLRNHTRTYKGNSKEVERIQSA